jgi:O-antigen/teichoic acid export membrane protein
MRPRADLERDGARPGSRRTRLSWGVGDQALSSLTNFGLGILVARTVTPVGFGAFSLSFATYTLLLGATRAIASEPLVVRYSDSQRSTWRTGVESATGTAVVIGTLAGAVCIAAGAVTGGAFRSALVPLGLMLPGLLVQDTWRYAFFAQHRPAAAFFNDLVWTCCQAMAVALVFLAGRPNVAWFVIAWGGAGAVAACAGALQAGVVPRPREVMGWLRAQRDLAPRYLAEFGARNGAQTGVVYAAASLSGLAAAGALRAGQIVLGPPNILNMGLTGAAIPEAVRALRRSRRHLWRLTQLLSLAIALPALLWGAVVLALPDDVGRALLGASWEPAQAVLVPLTLALAASGALTGPTVGLRALEDARRSLRARLITGAMSFGGGLVGTVIGGAPGAATGLAAGLWTGVVAWWWVYGVALGVGEKAVGAHGVALGARAAGSERIDRAET